MHSQKLFATKWSSKLRHPIWKHQSGEIRVTPEEPELCLEVRAKSKESSTPLGSVRLDCFGLAIRTSDAAVSEQKLHLLVRSGETDATCTLSLSIRVQMQVEFLCHGALVTPNQVRMHILQRSRLSHANLSQSSVTPLDQPLIRRSGLEARANVVRPVAGGNAAILWATRSDDSSSLSFRGSLLKRVGRKSISADVQQPSTAAAPSLESVKQPSSYAALDSVMEWNESSAELVNDEANVVTDQWELNGRFQACVESGDVKGIVQISQDFVSTALLIVSSVCFVFH